LSARRLQATVGQRSSQQFSAIELREAAVECSEREVTPFTSDLENHAIRESELWSFSKVRDRLAHDDLDTLRVAPFARAD
jgi:hypothetical protein